MGSLNSNKEKTNSENILYSLPLGESLFHDLREDGQIYVDKTALIYELLKPKKNFIFISRPRRFGKSLLVSTFASLFKNGLADFHGLAIEKLWHDDTYPVIHLDLASCINFTDLEAFKKQFLRSLKDAVEACGIDFPKKDDEDDDSVAARFNRLFLRGALPKLVLLVDEYDTPLNHCLHNKDLFDKVALELNSFYAVIKQFSGAFRFIFITGICKYKNLGLFSGTNFIKDISLFAKYGTLLGYTGDEIKQFFGPFVQRAADQLGLSFDECIAEIRHHYDGYCFDEQALTHVYNPWSVLNFLDEPGRKFKNYWYDSAGRPSMLENYLRSHALRDPLEYGKDQLISADNLDSSQEVLSLNDVTLLYQAGYLTIKAVDPNGALFTLNYPNIEVSHSMSKLYTENVFGVGIETAIGTSSLSVFMDYSVDEIVAKLNLAFARVNYSSFPIESEYALQRDLQLFLQGGGVNVDVEKHNAYGRSDLEFIAGCRYFVIELKLAKKEDDPKKLLEQAMAQIKIRHYGEQYENATHLGRVKEKLQLMRLALVFSEEQRQFVDYAIISDP